MDKVENPLELLARDPVKLSLFSLKSKLMMIIAEIIYEKEWSQKDAAKSLEISQPRVSNLVNGQLDKFSIDTLIELLGKLGYLMDISFNPAEINMPIEVKVKKAAV